MDINQIRTFVTIAEARSFSGAGTTLHRSQPAISRRIELLEQEVGIALFERLRGGVALTDAGAALLPYAASVLAAMKDGLTAVQAVRTGDAGQISLALVGTLASDALTKVLRKFQRKHSAVRLDIQTATSQEVEELVLRGEATLGLRYTGSQNSDLVSQVVWEDRLLLVARPDHPLADGRNHRPIELTGERWVAFTSRRSPEAFVKFLERKLLMAGLDQPEIVPIDGLTAQKRLVEAGFGIALLAESNIREELRAGSLRIIEVPALRATIPVALVHRRKAYLGEAARYLLAMISALAPLAKPNRRSSGANRKSALRTR
ncbi:MAG TPA: LysR family transcriptional regulator [Bradyrhizobium sp.]|uniref:LysR family transcriptional regulator n=1 Tax=Bradyrhizobium sp. TaxID=376 RepID=UPI002B483961|nr:LysR family transcriptional regulator [Bradyrhizobium sp.]HKO73556.1 LysR family transcriptional regulator [Bradyrhizobium sp.]